jgi:hypothetical protein
LLHKEVTSLTTTSFNNNKRGGWAILLMVEILLTVSVWRENWKAWAVMPLCSGVAIAVIMGLAIGANGGTKGDLTVPSLIIDGMCIAALLIMRAHAPKRVKAPQLAQEALPSEG